MIWVTAIFLSQMSIYEALVLTGKTDLTHLRNIEMSCGAR